MTHVQFSPSESGHSPIASQFVVAYYQKTLKRDYSALRDYYGEHSILSFARLHQDQTSCIGPEAIVLQLNTFTESLGKFKLDISTVDAVPAGSTIVITCSGSIFTALQEDVFSHTFVLVPTQSRKDCYYILVEAFRVLSSEKEAESSTATPNATSVAPSNPFANAAPTATAIVPEAPAKKEKEAFSDRWNNAGGKTDETKVAAEEPVKPAEVAEAPAAQPERKHRERNERKPRQENIDNNNSNNTEKKEVAPVAESKSTELSSSSGITDRAVRPVAWTEAADRHQDRERPTQPTHQQPPHMRKEFTRNTLGLLGLDRSTTMDEVWYACARMGKIKTVRWWGEDNAAVEMRYDEDAEKMCSATFRFKIKNRVVKVEAISPEQFDELPRE